jgi:hypothetical protein
MLNH